MSTSGDFRGADKLGMLVKLRSVGVDEALQERRVATLERHRFGAAKPIVAQPLRGLSLAHDIEGDRIGYAVVPSQTAHPVAENLIDECPTG